MSLKTAILEYLEAHGAASCKELARQFDKPKSTISARLTALVSSGAVRTRSPQTENARRKTGGRLIYFVPDLSVEPRKATKTEATPAG